MNKYIFLIGIIFLSGLNSLLAEPKPMNGQPGYFIIPVDYEGVTWRCKRCGYYNYSESPDWKDDYFCLRCKTRKGDE